MRRRRVTDASTFTTAVLTWTSAALSSIRVRMPEWKYGTRSSAVVLVDHHNNAFFCERSFRLDSDTHFEEVCKSFDFKMHAHTACTK